MKTKRLCWPVGVVVPWGAAFHVVWAVTPRPRELAESRRWATAKFEGIAPTETPTVGRRADGSEPFLSFTYGGKPSSELLKTWEIKRTSRPLDAQRTERTLNYTDPRTGLVVRCVGIEYGDSPAVEWVVSMQNTGPKDTPILEAIQAIDTPLPLPSADKPVLHWAKGGVASFDDFAPQETVLQPGAKVHLQPGDGRSSNQVLPFFNVAAAKGGVVIAVGWSGEWAADFSCDFRGVTLKAGLARTHLVLHPGESIRTPRMLLVFYDQDRWRGRNLLRQTLLTHYRPRRDGKLLVAPITWGTWGGSATRGHPGTSRHARTRPEGDRDGTGRNPSTRFSSRRCRPSAAAAAGKRPKAAGR